MTNQELQIVREYFQKHPLDLSNVTITDDGIITVDIKKEYFQSIPQDILTYCRGDVTWIFYLSTSSNTDAANAYGHSRQIPINTPCHKYKDLPDGVLNWGEQWQKNPSPGTNFTINTGAQLAKYNLGNSTLYTNGISFVAKPYALTTAQDPHKYKFLGQFGRETISNSFTGWRDHILQGVEYERSSVNQTHYRFSACVTCQLLYKEGYNIPPHSLVCQNSKIISWEMSFFTWQWTRI